MAQGDGHCVGRVVRLGHSCQMEQPSRHVHHLAFFRLAVPHHSLLHLGYIKSVSLLPKHEELEEQLKKELTGQLIEYTLCRQVAQLLKNRFAGDELFVRPMQKDAAVSDTAYPLHHNSRLLLDAYLSAVGRRKLPQQENRSFEPMMARRVVSVNSRIVVVMKLLYRKKRTSFLSLFESSSDRSEVVATFLAVLELMKNKRVLLESDGKTIRLL